MDLRTLSAGLAPNPSIPKYQRGDLAGLEAGLRGGMNKPLLGALPDEQYMGNRFNPTLMQGKDLLANMVPGIGDLIAARDAKRNISQGSYGSAALDIASLVPGIGDLARMGGTPLLGAMTAFHGSPFKFDKFQMEKIGTGEGAQAYGHGLYFAENPGVAKSYQEKLLLPGWSKKIPTRSQADEYVVGKIKAYEDEIGASPDKDTIADWINQDYSPEGYYYEGNYITPDEIEQATEDAYSLYPKGQLYEVDIPDEAIGKMLDWDAPLSEQPESVRKALSPVIRDLHLDSKSGESIYAEIVRINQRDMAAASEYLNSLGIPGIKYYDGSSRAAGEGTRNFVVFDDTIPKILNRK